MDDPATNRNLELFLTRDQIHQRVQQLGAQISRDFAGESLLLVGVLKGAAIFLADLARAITIDCSFDFISAASYGTGTQSSGSIRVLNDLDQPIENRNVLLVEDILDTGTTLCHLRKVLLAQKPSRLEIVSLLDKPSRRLQTIEAKYVGFTIADRFVVGYGLDHAGRYRNLPAIYFLTSNV